MSDLRKTGMGNESSQIPFVFYTRPMRSSLTWYTILRFLRSGVLCEIRWTTEESVDKKISDVTNIDQWMSESSVARLLHHHVKTLAASEVRREKVVSQAIHLMTIPFLEDRSTTSIILKTPCHLHLYIFLCWSALGFKAENVTN